MRIINILVGIVLPAAGLLAWLWFGYQKTNTANSEDGIELITFDQYVIGWVSSLGSPDGAGLSDLNKMLPRDPEGWTRRKIRDADAAALWVDGLDPLRQTLLQDAALKDEGEGVTTGRAAWTTPEGTLVAEITRYPDTLFDTPQGGAVLAANRDPFGRIGNHPLINIGGLGISEAKLPPQMPARVLRAVLEDQIVLRVSAPRTMSDESLLAFFSTLNVAAMNAALAAPVAGMGELRLEKRPIAVLVEQMSDAERALIGGAAGGFAAERARISAAREAAWAALDAETLAAAAGAAAATTNEVSEAVGIRRGVSGNDPGRSSFKTNGGNGSLKGDCQQVGGRKVCGVAAPQAD